MARLITREIASLLAATHAGITPDAFRRDRQGPGSRPPNIRSFTASTKQCLYQPQLELLAYLRANGFKLFIVTGGGIEFVRAFAEEAYGIPPERVIGSSTKTRFEIR